MTSYAANQSARAAHRAIKSTLETMDRSHGCAVLWFADIKSRRLFRKLGYSSMNLYAQQALGFSETRASDFSSLADRIAVLPRLKAALQEGKFGYTKARMISRVCNPANEEEWVNAASTKTRAQLDILTKQARRAATQERKRQPELPPAAAGRVSEIPAASRRNLPSPPSSPACAPLFEAPALPSPQTRPAAVVPVRLTIEFTPEQYARYEALLERAGKVGHPLPTDRAEAILTLLAHHVDSIKTKASTNFPRGKGQGATAPSSPCQIHVHHCPACSQTAIPTGKGDLPLSPAGFDRLTCDADIITRGRNKATIPPRIRRKVLSRDGHRCRRPGCRHTQFLEIHHVTPRSRGGSNDPANLITLCSGCHQLLHEKKWAEPGFIREPVPWYGGLPLTGGPLAEVEPCSTMARQPDLAPGISRLRESP